MNNRIDIKRGTTPALPITIFMPYENIKHIDFIFKKQLDDKYPKMLELSFDFPDDENVIDRETDSFIVNAKLTEEETRKLIEGVVYMDTRIVLTNNEIPKTEIVEVDVGETLFGEVYNK
jgi:hypothetical protein